MKDKTATMDYSKASVITPKENSDQMSVSGVYSVQCHDAEGNLKWEDPAFNLVTTAGKNFLLDTTLAGTSYTASMYVGLISSVSYSQILAADTMASHSGWLEAGGANLPTYSETARPAATWNAATAGSKTFSAGKTFTINGAGTIKGCFITTVATKDGTTGTLYSAGLFSGGDKTVQSGDVITVSYTTQLT